jgi:hypothetical protein
VTTTISGYQFLGVTRDEEGQRDYKLLVVVVSDNGLDGPGTAMNTPGLPVPGATWGAFTTSNGLNFAESDLYAWCRGNLTVDPAEQKDEKVTVWHLTFLFSTKPQKPDKQRCLTTPVTDPLLEPPKINGSYTKEKEAAMFDRFGFQILNSAYEPVRGPQVEFDADRPTVTIEQNVGTAFQGYILPALMANCVNEYPLWGCAPRTIKMTPGGWSREYYGTCLVYYKRKLTFDIRKETWDRVIMDEGTKVLAGDWKATTTSTKPVWKLRPYNPNPFDPSNYIRFTDVNGNPANVVLNGAGLPANVTVSPVGSLSAAYIAAVVAARDDVYAMYDFIETVAAAQQELADGTITVAAWQAMETAWSVQLLQWVADFQAVVDNAPGQTQTAVTAAHMILGLNIANEAMLVDLGLVQVGAAPDQDVQVLVAVNGLYILAADFTQADNTGTGSGFQDFVTTVGQVYVSKYNGVDFLQLGIPSSF